MTVFRRSTDIIRVLTVKVKTLFVFFFGEIDSHGGSIEYRKKKNRLLLKLGPNCGKMLQEGDIMKAIIAILLVVIVGFLAYTYFTSLSEEEQQVKALEKQFDLAVGDFLRALRTMSGTGLDTTSDVDDAVVKIKKVKKELKSLKSSLQESGAQERAGKLDAKIKEFERKNDIEQY